MNGTQYRKKKNEQVREFVPTKNKYYRSQIKPKPQSRHDLSTDMTSIQSGKYVGLLSQKSVCSSI